MSFLKLYLFFVTILLFCKINSQNLEKPNFIFFLVDDLGYSDIGCYGSNYYKTPSIDKLAAEGAMFTNAYSSGMVCSPSRASILIGKYPFHSFVCDPMLSLGFRLF